MTNMIAKSLEWIPFPGFTRERIVEELTRECVASKDCGDHVWVAVINNLGTILFCYGLQVGAYKHFDREINVYYVKRIPESVGPDVYDCPDEILDMCRIQNAQWREQLRARRSAST